MLDLQNVSEKIMHDSDIVKKFYNRQVEHEWTRAERHPIEFEITKRLLLRNLPKPPAKILDLGGGPGHYSFWLTRLGYSVTLFDLSEENITFAREKDTHNDEHIDSFIVGNALDLNNLNENKYDAVLIMGPLYHLTEKANREKVIKNALRVLKPNGIIASTFISAYAPIIDILKKYPDKTVGNIRTLLGYFSNGTNIVSDDGFTAAYFSRIEEVEELMSSFPIKKIGCYAVESILGPYEEVLKKYPKEVISECITLAMEFVEDPHCIGCAEHLLYIAQNGKC